MLLLMMMMQLMV